MKTETELIMELAKRARIAVREEDCERYARDLFELEALCASLLELEGTPSDGYRARGTDALREDCVGVCLPREAVEAMAPAWEEGMIPVLRAVEGGEQA